MDSVLERNCDIYISRERRDYVGPITALNEAAILNKIESVKFLVSRKADLNLQTIPDGNIFFQRQHYWKWTWARRKSILFFPSEEWALLVLLRFASDPLW